MHAQHSVACQEISQSLKHNYFCAVSSMFSRQMNKANSPHLLHLFVFFLCRCIKYDRKMYTETIATFVGCCIVWKMRQEKCCLFVFALWFFDNFFFRFLCKWVLSAMLAKSNNSTNDDGKELGSEQTMEKYFNDAFFGGGCASLCLGVCVCAISAPLERGNFYFKYLTFWQMQNFHAPLLFSHYIN